MGRNGVNALLNLANLRHLLESYPPNNFDLSFSFNELSRLMSSLDEMYGVRGGRGLALRVGRACFRLGIRDMGPMLGVADLTFRIMPLTAKVRVGLDVFAEVFVKFSDSHVRIDESEDHFFWIADPCPICWGRMASAPICNLAVGIMQEALYWLSGGQNFDVQEVACAAMGEPSCTFQIDKQSY